MPSQSEAHQAEAGEALQPNQGGTLTENSPHVESTGRGWGCPTPGAAKRQPPIGREPVLCCCEEERPRLKNKSQFEVLLRCLIRLSACLRTEIPTWITIPSPCIRGRSPHATRGKHRRISHSSRSLARSSRPRSDPCLPWLPLGSVPGHTSRSGPPFLLPSILVATGHLPPRLT